MNLYHGSSKKFDVIRKSQARKGEGMDVPEQELLNGIYLTPNYEFALAIASMPPGAANIDMENKEIEFENKDEFDPEKEVYIYEIKSEKIPSELLIRVDNNQFVVTEMDELRPDGVKETIARELLEYFRIKDFNENQELKIIR